MISKKNILLITTTLSILSGCGQEQAPEKVEVVRPAKLIEVTASSNIKHFNFPAVVEALSSKDLTFQVSGQIEKLNVREGQEVKQGDVIATLVQRSFNNQLQTAQTQYDAAKLDFDRAQRLIRENAIAQTVYDQRLTQLNVTSAQLDTAKKAMEDTVLRSPFDGVVAVKHAKELDTVSPTQPVFTLQTEGAAEAMVKIPASLVTRSKQIEPIETVVVLDAANQYEIEAEFVAALAQADERSQTFEVRFGFTPPEDLVILPGMTGVVKASLRLSSDAQEEGQISIPLSAVLSDSEGQYVWKVNSETMTVARQNVQVGAGVGEALAIESGLVAGDTIVGAGASYLHDGMKIRRLEN
ncbi:efflux RND transporter periplasmic adaptor subunit [Aliiglaciecola sp. M165]|uniref:efflux RND transporter periplasmic adaptor subunit n=1 Tax=Aliiglaciecola sp. M165 TaxID=2593649 RepID=UPI001180A174|nr:efflux RND transporter periplasmic adaptor subunit [Aliiglaciecola sp. M165]TRY29220.1 efflux RND transporter periplasmic adaptor subunit [Aliiglaciecola sp. M165]